MALLTGILTGGVNNHPTTSEEANAVSTDFVSQGIVGTVTNTGGVAPATGGFAANAQGSPDMTVAITAGVAYVTGTPTSQNSQTFRVKLTANQNVTIAANSSGSTKYDWIYIKLDATKLNGPNLAGDDVATLVTSRSTSSSSDDGTPPTYGYNIAKVTVANGASSISNGSIADTRVTSGVNASLTDGTVTPAKLQSGTGSTWAYASWTPTFTGLTVGNGTLSAQYNQTGKTVNFRVKFTLGSTSSVAAASDLIMTLPVTTISGIYTQYFSPLGLATMRDVSPGDTYMGTVAWYSTTQAVMQSAIASGTYLVTNNVDSDEPFTWANGDSFYVQGTYEAA